MPCFFPNAGTESIQRNSPEISSSFPAYREISRFRRMSVRNQLAASGSRVAVHRTV